MAEDYGTKVAEPKGAAVKSTVPKVTSVKPGATPRLYREMVAAGSTLGYNNRLSLPQTPDDITQEFGLEVYEKMLLDAQVNACVTFWKAAILEDGLKLTPAVNDPGVDGFDMSRDFVKEACKMFDEMPVHIDDALWDMLNGVVFGMKVGELVYEVRNNRLDLARFKVKPCRAVALVVDQYMNMIGLIGAKPGQTTPITSSIIDPLSIIPPEKFAIFTFRPRDADPRGTSIIRSAYSAWWMKQQLRPEYMKYLSQFAGPSVIGYTPDDATIEATGDPEEDADFTTPEEAMLNTLVQWRNGSAAVFPGGSKVDIHGSEGEGNAFVTANAGCNLEITKAILGQELATEQSKFMARAAAQVHQDVLDTLIRQGKQAVVRMVYQQVLQRWMRYNWEPKYHHLCPVPSLGRVEERDRTRIMTAVAALMRADFFAPEQLPDLDKLMGFPVRSKRAIDIENQKDEAELKKAQEEAKPAPAPIAPQPQPAPTDTKPKENEAKPEPQSKPKPEQRPDKE